MVKRGYLVTSDLGGRGQSWQLASVLLATLALVASLLIVGAGNPSSVLGAPGSNTTNFQVAVSGPVSAGTPFSVTVTAKDSRGRTVNSYPGGAALSGLAAAPNGQATPTYGTLTTWVNGVASTTVTAVKSQTSAQLTATDTIDGVTVTGSATFAVAPSSAASLSFADGPNTFNGQPVDTEFDTEIASSLSASFVAVKVIALDTFGNRVGGVVVTMSASPNTPDPADDLDGDKIVTTNGSGAFGTSTYGEAEFTDLSITKFGNYTLTATAGTLSATSTSFEIVADLEKCTGSTCKSTGRSAGTNLQITFSSLTGVSLSNVALTTSFIGAASDVECANPADAFGELSEVRVQGTGVQSAQPDFQLAMIIPKTSLQNLGLTSRAADTYNMCLGATRLDGGTSGWKGRTAVGGPIVTLTDPDNDGIYWGFPAECGNADLREDDPCLSLKTKNAGQLQAELGLSKAEFKTLGFASSDLAVVLRKPFPWDGKSGLY
jgi:hypothetical protein